MFLLDAPYVSDFLKQTAARLGQPVLDTPGARELCAGTDLAFVDPVDFAARVAGGERVLANSENTLEHLFHCDCHEELARQIAVCKDKALFRETLAGVHPDYLFRRAAIGELRDLDISDFTCPFVVKPARGFFSLGVHVVDSPDQWPGVLDAIDAEQEAMNREYPREVVDGTEFIVEAGIEGEEYAIDVYYDENGAPVITNILHHHFVSADDISDRLYYTSPDIIRTWLGPFNDYVETIGRACGLRDFPIHLELRVDDAGVILPIEANPLRFAGWCVADITHHAWGINPYEYYFENKRPDWDAILEGRENACVMVVAEVPSGVDRNGITHIDFEGFEGLFDNVLELRRIDHTRYPVFAFAFAAMAPERMDGLKTALVDDFSRFITT